MLDLQKSKQVVLNLTKELGLGDQKAQVVLAIDYSGSMGHLYHNGTVQKIVERLVPIAMAFDDNEAMEVYRFDHNYRRMTTDVTPTNYKDYVDKHIFKGGMGGTEYAPVMKAIISEATSGGVSKSILSKLFGGKTVSDKQPAEYPTYVIFITDGDCSDKAKALQTIKECSNLPIFWQFVGIGHASFRTLEQLDTVSGRVLDNANFFSIRNTQDLATMSDEDLYQKYLVEFPGWVKEAKQMNMVK